MKTNKSTVLTLLLPAVGVVLLFVAFFAMKSGQMPTETSSGKALIGGHFSLVDHTGKRVTDQDYLGKYQLVYFGYTYCPEICPTTLQSIEEAMERLGEKTAADFVTLFITVDPERDKPEQLADYVSNFGKHTVGLTGTSEELIEAAKAFRVYSKKVVAEDAVDFDHSAITFLMDRKGKYVTHFAYGVDGEAMAKKIKEIYKPGGAQKPAQKISGLN